MAMDPLLEFEKPVHELENQIKELKETQSLKGVDINDEIKALQKKVDILIQEIFGNLTSWERVQLCRHPMRPHSCDYIQHLIPDFREIHGDRNFGDDSTIVTGLGHLLGQRVAVVGIEKGRKTQEKVKRNFGMPNPEGYRKALRLYQMAERFGLPIISFIDTPGAYPGIGAEERGQSHAIAEIIAQSFSIKTPIISVVVGEGGSGGALGLGIGDKVLMMEFSIYSVISPESCASILWSDPSKAEKAANALQLGPQNALELKIIDGIIPEPPGGAHRDTIEAMDTVGREISKHVKSLLKVEMSRLLADRFGKFRSMGNSTIENLGTDLFPLFKFPQS